MAFPNLAILATTIMVSLILWLGVGSSTGAPPQVASFEQPARNANKPLNDSRLVTRTLALVEKAYLLSGMDREQAAEMREQYAEDYGLRSGVPASGKSLYIIPRRNPELGIVHALLYAGIEFAFAEDILQSLGLIPDRSETELLASAAPVRGPSISCRSAAEPECEVYQITIIWCGEDEHGKEIRMSTSEYISKLCWNQVLACPATAVCAGEDITWYSLTVDSDCDDLDIPVGQCVYVAAPGEWVKRPCSLVNASCACFEETSGSVTCGQIEQTCGGKLDGPPDEGDTKCPDCEGS